MKTGISTKKNHTFLHTGCKHINTFRHTKSVYRNGLNIVLVSFSYFVWLLIKIFRTDTPYQYGCVISVTWHYMKIIRRLSFRALYS